MIGAANPAQHISLSRTEVLERRLAAAGLDWIVPHWPAPADVVALTTTRVRERDATIMASEPTVRPMTEDASGAIADTCALAAFVPSPPIWLKQVHGTSVAVLDQTSIIAARKTPPVADAAVTRLRGVVCAVETADCLPVLFADRHGGAIGVAHAGWRGLSAGVLEATVSALLAQNANADNLIAWLGPAIGPAAFEVGSDVVSAFCAHDHGAETCFALLREGKWRADIYSLARRRLAAVGVHDVKGGGWCTFSDAARFYSYRRERKTGRMVTLVWLADDTKL